MSDEELVALHHQYGHFCAEKCRLLSSIEQNNREGRSLQKEIHRLLDFVAECIPMEDILSDIDDSDPELPWLEEADYQQTADEEGYLSFKVHELKERYASLKSNNLVLKPARRRSISPERKGKSRRNYRHLPIDDDGAVELPLVLGRAVHRTIVTSIGKVRKEDEFRNERFLYPVGFQCKRKYFTFDSDYTGPKPEKVFYYCYISEFEGKPMFEILLNDEASSEEEPLERETDLSVLWNKFRNRFSQVLKNKMDEDFSHPESFMGLDHETLLKHLTGQLLNLENKT